MAFTCAMRTPPQTSHGFNRNSLHGETVTSNRSAASYPTVSKVRQAARLMCCKNVAIMTG